MEKQNDKSEKAYVAEEVIASDTKQSTDPFADAQDDSSIDENDLRQELEELKSRFEVAQDQLKRAVADYHNLEKRVAEGRSELAAWASGELIRKILPSLDHLEKALDGASENEKDSGWLKGVEMSLNQLKQVLKEEGLEEIEADPSTSSERGVRFDPSLHEAVDTAEGNEGEVLEVVEKGYNLNGKVLRPAKVVVGRKS